MQDTHEEVKKHLLNIFNKKENSLPEWALLVDVARKVKYETNFENTTFATWVYYAIKDLLQPVKGRWYEITKVNKKNKTITAIAYEMPKNGVEKKIGETTWTPKEAFWDSLYKNKPLDFLNKGRRPNQIPKLSIYLIKDPNENVVKNWTNEKKIEENLDKLFKPIIDTDIPVISFEQVIEKLKGFPKDETDLYSENNFTHSTIEDYIEPFKEKIEEADYDNLIHALNIYFTDGKFPQSTSKIRVGYIPVKSFAYAFGRLHFDLKPDQHLKHSTAYLSYLKNNISRFKEINIKNLLAYMSSKPTT
jgi:hypothetical protein